MNENGLLSNKDIASRGDVNSNYFRRVANGVPILFDVPRAHAFATIDTNNSAIIIRNNYNLQSVVRNSNGNYTVTMTNQLVSNRYAVVVTIEGNQTGVGYMISYVISTSKIFFIRVSAFAGLSDPNAFSFAVYGIAPGPVSPPNQSELVIPNNGLFISNDLAATGQVESNYYINKNVIVPLPAASAVKAFAYVSNAPPTLALGEVTIANSFNIDRIEQTGNFSVFRVFFKVPFPNNFYNVIATVGGTGALFARTQADSPGSFLLIINTINNPTGQYPLATSFYFAVFRN